MPKLKFMIAGLALSFVAMGTARASVPLGQLLFLLAATGAAGAAAVASSALSGSNRLAAIGAASALAAVCIFGATEIGVVDTEEWQSLSFFVAPTAGLATMWYAGHTLYRDPLRWVVSLVGAGWTAIGALAFAIFSAQASGQFLRSEAARVDGGALASIGYGLAALLAFSAATLVMTGAARSVLTARKR